MRHARPASQRRRAPARAARPLTTPRGPRGPRASVPHHVQADVTVEVTAHSVKRRRHTGPGPARGPTRRGSGAPGLPDNALLEEKPAACKNQSKRSNGWGRGVARHAATGLRKATERALHSDGQTGAAEWSSTSVPSQRSLRGRNGRNPCTTAKEPKTCTSVRPRPVMVPGCPSGARGPGVPSAHPGPALARGAG